MKNPDSFEAMLRDLQQSIERKRWEIDKLIHEKEVLVDCASRLSTCIEDARQKNSGL